jgi:hypothetical protein
VRELSVELISLIIDLLFHSLYFGLDMLEGLIVQLVCTDNMFEGCHNANRDIVPLLGSKDSQGVFQALDSLRGDSL